VKTVPLRRVLSPRDETNRTDLQVLSVYREHGVVPKQSRSDNFNKTPVDVSRYLRVAPGDLVVNKMKAWSGSVAVSQFEGIVSGDYLVCAVEGMRPKYLHYLLRSSELIGQMRIRSSGIRPSQERLYWEDLADIEVRLPDAAEQQQWIADFLDDRVARIDRIIAARREQIVSLHATLARRSFAAVAGRDEKGGRKASGLEWLGDVPAGWAMLTVSSDFVVDLGKMLDEKRQTGEDSVPYLRNTNVQWDRIDTSDLKSMDIGQAERQRFTLRLGDLLICEGGQPGRSAIWDGSVSLLGYQKALHRARSRGRSRPAWLLECLRVAVHMNAFAIENGQTTIGHLTNEQLRGQRFPFPDPEVQDRLLSDLAAQRAETLRISSALSRSIDLLTEYKSSLITAAVIGELDVTTAGSGIAG